MLIFKALPLFPAEIQPIFNLCHLCHMWHKWQTTGTTIYGLLEITSNKLCRHLFEDLVISGHILPISVT